MSSAYDRFRARAPGNGFCKSAFTKRYASASKRPEGGKIKSSEEVGKKKTNCGPSTGFYIPTLSSGDDTKHSAGLIGEEKYWTRAKSTMRGAFLSADQQKKKHSTPLHCAAPRRGSFTQLNASPRLHLSLTFQRQFTVIKRAISLHPLHLHRLQRETKGAALTSWLQRSFHVIHFTPSRE